MATVQPDRIGAGFRTTEKMQCSKPSLSLDLHQALGNLRGDFTGWKREMVFRALLFMLSRGRKAHPVRR